MAIDQASLGSTQSQKIVHKKLLFIVQVSAILLVISCSLINLSISHYSYSDKKDDKLWIVLLSSTLGYLLPNPKLKTGLKSVI